MSKSMNQRRQRIQVVIRDRGITYHLIATGGRVNKLPDTIPMHGTPEDMVINRALLHAVNKRIKGTDNQTVLLTFDDIVAEVRNGN